MLISFKKRRKRSLCTWHLSKGFTMQMATKSHPVGSDRSAEVDYREAEGKVCILYGHGAFTIENVGRPKFRIGIILLEHFTTCLDFLIAISRKHVHQKNAVTRNNVYFCDIFLLLPSCTYSIVLLFSKVADSFEIMQSFCTAIFGMIRMNSPNSSGSTQQMRSKMVISSCQKWRGFDCDPNKVRTLCEHRCKKVVVMCRKRGLEWNEFLWEICRFEATINGFASRLEIASGRISGIGEF